MTTEINLNHICKIEGHAHLNLKIENNKVKECNLKASEGARFFEGLVAGKNISDIQEIVSRICGICSSSHSVASIQALENALDIKPTQQQTIIRELLMAGERIRNHATHLYFLSLPDYFDKESALQMLPEHRETIDQALHLISLGNNIIETFGGREMHPFLEIKKEFPEEDLNKIKDKLIKSKPIILKTIELFKTLKFPNLDRITNYLSLSNNTNYPDISGNIKSSNKDFETNDYKKHLTESIKEYATSKFVLMNNKPYMLGSMSRINNNHKFLDTETKEILNQALKDLNLTIPLKNPFYNLLCQAIEILESTNKTINIIENLPKIKPEKNNIKIKQGNGISAVEAPRGTLFHEYKIDKEGIITFCNIITPTTQNLNMIETDITQLVNYYLSIKSSKDLIIKDIEKLIRAYDPCFSCSTHFLKVDWN